MFTFRPVAAAIAAACALFCALAAARAANPTANAGADQTIAYGALPALVTLSGSGVDPDAGAITGYLWSVVDIPPGSAATLSSAIIAGPTFTADVVGTYRFCLKVTDDQAETNGTDFLAQPTAACTNVMATTANLALVEPAKGQRNTWDLVNAWATALDALKGDFDDFVALIASTSAGAEGAAEVGTDAKVNLDNATTVEVALTYLDSILTTVGPYLPLAGGTMVGDILVGTDNTYDIGSATKALAQLWALVIDSTGALTIGGTAATSVGVGRAAVALTLTGSNVSIVGNTNITGHLRFQTDNTYEVGATAKNVAQVWTRQVNSNGSLAIGPTVVSAAAGYDVTLTAGPGAAAAGATPGDVGGSMAIYGGTGGAAGAALAAGAGNAVLIAGGDGGAGSATNAGANGAAAYIDGGTGGADGGAGAGSDGGVCIACNVGDLVTLGSGVTDVDVQGTLQLNGADVTAAAAELNQVCDGVGVTATAANLNTLTNGSDASALHSHAGTYLPLAGGTMSGDIAWSSDNARDLGSSTNASRAVYANSVLNSTQNLTISTIDGAATVSSLETRIETGDGGASDGISVGADAGDLRFTGGQGGAGSGAIAAGTGATFFLTAGRGGTGTAIVTGGTGGDTYINAGTGGLTGGAGAGAAGGLYIGTVAAASITIGKAATTTAIAGTADLPTTWQINSTTVNATAANLNTLVGGTSSNADALHRHALPAIFAVDRGSVSASASAESVSAIAQWSIPTDTLVTVRCTGWCVASAADDTACKFRVKDEAGTTLLTHTIPAGECGDTGSTIAAAQSFDETFATSGLGADTFGEIYVVSDSGTSDCKIGRLSCWAY